MEATGPKTRWRAAEEGAWRWRVLLDGQPVELCMTADVEAGRVEVAAVNALGIVIREPSGPEAGEVQREARRGRVEIVRREGTAG